MYTLNELQSSQIRVYLYNWKLILLKNSIKLEKICHYLFSIVNFKLKSSSLFFSKYNENLTHFCPVNNLPWSIWCSLGNFQIRIRLSQKILEFYIKHLTTCNFKFFFNTSLIVVNYSILLFFTHISILFHFKSSFIGL